MNIYQPYHHEHVNMEGMSHTGHIFSLMGSVNCRVQRFLLKVEDPTKVLQPLWSCIKGQTEVPWHCRSAASRTHRDSRTALNGCEGTGCQVRQQSGNVLLQLPLKLQGVSLQRIALPNLQMWCIRTTCDESEEAAEHE